MHNRHQPPLNRLLFLLDPTLSHAPQAPTAPRLLLLLQPVPRGDRDRARGLNGMARENGTTGSDVQGGDGGECADGDEDSGDGGHGFGMFGREEVESVGGVEEPQGR